MYQITSFYQIVKTIFHKKSGETFKTVYLNVLGIFCQSSDVNGVNHDPEQIVKRQRP